MSLSNYLDPAEVDAWAKRESLPSRLVEFYGVDLVAEVVADVAIVVRAYRDLATGDERDGVWEEGYADACHDILLALGLTPEQAAS